MRVSRFATWVLVPLLSAGSLSAASAVMSLVEAVKTADRETVRALLRQKRDVNIPENDGTTALHWAVHRDDVDTAALLVRAGANVGAANRYGVTPLQLAAANGSASMIAVLLEAGADPNSTLPEGETALMAAAKTGNVEALKLLLAHGAGVNATERWRGQTALMWAAAHNHSPAIQTLIEHGANIETRSWGGFSPLHFAARAGQADAVRTLLAAGANVNDTVQPTDAARIPRLPAIGSGGRNQSASETHGTSALMLTVANGHFELAKELLDRGAEPNADAQGWTALHQLAWTRRPHDGKGIPPVVPTGALDSLDLAKALLAHGADSNARVKRDPRDGNRNRMTLVGATVFLLAAKAVDVPFMRVLLVHGADPLMPTVDKITPLMAAAGVGIYGPGENPGTNDEVFEAVRLLCELGSDVNAVDASGETALHGVALRGATTAAQFLVDKGARLDAQNKLGWKPLRVADGVGLGVVKRQPETAALLRRLMKDRGVLSEEDAVTDGVNVAVPTRRRPQ